VPQMQPGAQCEDNGKPETTPDGDRAMTGSSLAPIIIPVVVAPALAIWLAMCYYAGRHPRWKPAGQQQASQRELAGTRTPRPAYWASRTPASHEQPAVWRARAAACRVRSA